MHEYAGGQGYGAEKPMLLQQLAVGQEWALSVGGLNLKVRFLRRVAGKADVLVRARCALMVWRLDGGWMGCPRVGSGSHRSWQLGAD